MGVPLFTGESLSPIVFARLHLLLCLPCGKFFLPFLALIKSDNVRHQASGNVFDHMLRDSGIVDEFFAPTQDDLLCIARVISASVSKVDRNREKVYCLILKVCEIVLF